MASGGSGWVCFEHFAAQTGAVQHCGSRMALVKMKAVRPDLETARLAAISVAAAQICSRLVVAVQTHSHWAQGPWYEILAGAAAAVQLVAMADAQKTSSAAVEQTAAETAADVDLVAAVVVVEIAAVLAAVVLAQQHLQQL